ncbi:HNH endonuclease [Nakamurella sp. PAMC28650]|nr:HNH endonuclease [Nakamurella sp. PAMC28650]
MSLDHIIPRSRAPHLRYDFSNLQPSHYLCNVAKGSKTN